MTKNNPKQVFIKNLKMTFANPYPLPSVIEKHLHFKSRPGYITQTPSGTGFPYLKFVKKRQVL